MAKYSVPAGHPRPVPDVKSGQAVIQPVRKFPIVQIGRAHV